MRWLSIVLVAVFALWLAGCNPTVGSDGLEQMDVEGVKKSADKGVAELNAALDKNDHVTQSCGRLADRIRRLQARQPDLDPQVKKEADDVSTALEGWKRLMLPGSPPKMSPEQLDKVRQLSQKANDVIVKMTPK